MSTGVHGCSAGGSRGNRLRWLRGSLARLLRLPDQLCLGFSGRLDHLFQLVVVSFGKQLIAFERRNDVGAPVDPPNRFGHLRIEGSNSALGGIHRGGADMAQAARTCIYGHLEERNAQRLSTSSLRRRLRLTLDDRVRPPHHPADNPVVSV